MPDNITSPASRNSRHAAIRLTPDDDARIRQIADALRAERRENYPSRATAIRFSLMAVANLLHPSGQLPALSAPVGPQR